jgi:hypothetical protein
MLWLSCEYTKLGLQVQNTFVTKQLQILYYLRHLTECETICSPPPPAEQDVKTFGPDQYAAVQGLTQEATLKSGQAVTHAGQQHLLPTPDKATVMASVT